jgi:hypothetical protein
MDPEHSPSNIMATTNVIPIFLPFFGLFCNHFTQFVGFVLFLDMDPEHSPLMILAW